MENLGSSEKLVGLEAGLAWSEKPTNTIVDPVPIRKRVCSNNLLKLLLLLLTIVLLMAAAFEVHRGISDELLTEEFSNRDGPGPSERALMTSPENSSATVDTDMVRSERLSKLREGINEFRESIKFKPTATPVTTTTVPRTASRIEIDITDELMSKLDKVDDLETRIAELDDVFRESEAEIDWAKAAQIYGDVWAALHLFEQTIHSELQRSGFTVNDYLDDPQVKTSTEPTTEMVESVSTVAPTEESKSSWSWHFSIGNWGSSSSDPETTEGPIDTESNLSEIETSSKESKGGFMSQIHIFPFSMSWGWNSEDEDENVTLDSVAQEVTTSKSEETSTVEPREQSAEISVPLNSPITEDYDYSSEDYYSYIFDNYMDQLEADETTGKTPLLEPEIGSITSSSLTEELEDGIQLPTTNTPPVSSPEPPLLVLDKEEESEPEKIILDKSVPTAPHFYKLFFKDGEFHLSDTLDDLMPNIEDHDYSMYPEYDGWLDLDKLFPDGHDYSDINSDINDSLGLLIPRLPDHAGTRSKRFVNNVQPAQGAVDDELLTEQAAGDMAVPQQAIDDENHVIRNEISETDGQRKLALQAKLNKYYKKMESISAHIDRLHKKFLRLNSLNDDYVSREFPSNE